jgi:hypothetical protein
MHACGLHVGGSYSASFLTMNEIYTTQRYMHMMHMISGMDNYEYIYREREIRDIPLCRAMP